MSERMHFVWLISKRELRDQMRDWRILMPLARPASPVRPVTTAKMTSGSLRCSSASSSDAQTCGTLAASSGGR